MKTVRETGCFEGEFANFRPVCLSAAGGNVAALKLLVASGANLQCADGDLSPLHWAALKNRPDVVYELARSIDTSRIPATRGGRTPLHIAAQGRVNALRALFRGGAAGAVTLPR